MKFGQQVNLIQWVLLGTLPHELVTSLPHDHMTLTNLFISCYKATVIKFGQWKQLLDRSPWGTSPFGVVMPLPFDHVTFINLYISSYREATVVTSIHTDTLVVISFLCQIFCNNKIRQILKERQMLLW